MYEGTAQCHQQATSLCLSLYFLYGARSLELVFGSNVRSVPSPRAQAAQTPEAFLQLPCGTGSHPCGLPSCQRPGCQSACALWLKLCLTAPGATAERSGRKQEAPAHAKQDPYSCILGCMAGSDPAVFFAGVLLGISTASCCTGFFKRQWQIAIPAQAAAGTPRC